MLFWDKLRDESKKVSFRFQVRPNEELLVEYSAYPNVGARFRAAATAQGNYHFELARGETLAVEMSAHTHAHGQNGTEVRAQAGTFENGAGCILIMNFEHRPSSSCAKCTQTSP